MDVQAFLLSDGQAKSAKIIDTVTILTNVVTIHTTTTHGFVAGQDVTITLDNSDSDYAGSTLAALCGTFEIATVNAGAKTFTFAFVHADVTVKTIAGTATTNGLKSPIPSGSSEITLTFPSGAKSLKVMLPDGVGQLNKVSGGATGGFVPLAQSTWYQIPGKVGDMIFILPTASKIHFEFDCVGGF